jgi:hypothetical protein
MGFRGFIFCILLSSGLAFADRNDFTLIAPDHSLESQWQTESSPLPIHPPTLRRVVDDPPVRRKSKAQQKKSIPKASRRSFVKGFSGDSEDRPAIQDAERPPKRETNSSYGFEVLEGRTSAGYKLDKCQLTPTTQLKKSYCIAYTAYHCVREALKNSRDNRVTLRMKQLGNSAYRVRVIRSKKKTAPDIVALILPHCTEETVNFTPLLDTVIPRGTPLQWASYWRKGLYPAVKAANDLRNPFLFSVNVASKMAGIRQGDSGGGAFVTIGGQKYLVAVLSMANFDNRLMNQFGSVLGIFTHIAGLREFNIEVEEQLREQEESQEPETVPL